MQGHFTTYCIVCKQTELFCLCTLATMASSTLVTGNCKIFSLACISNYQSGLLSFAECVWETQKPGNSSQPCKCCMHGEGGQFKPQESQKPRNSCQLSKFCTLGEGEDGNTKNLEKHAAPRSVDSHGKSISASG